MYTVVQLKKICKNKGIKGYSKMKKAELIKYCNVSDLDKICKEMGYIKYPN